MKLNRSLQSALSLMVVVLIMAACAPKSPEERVAKLRTYYKARVVGIVVQAVPQVEEPTEAGDMAMTDGEDESADPAAEAMSDEELLAEAADTPDTPVLQNVGVDILLQHDSPEKLPGITLDIEMVDSNEQPKNSWKLWVDTSSLPKATGTQFTHLLENIDYVEGDGFSVEVRSYVPPEERGEYREFSDPLGG